MLLLGFTHLDALCRKEGKVRWLRNESFDTKNGMITVRIPPLGIVGQLDPSIAVLSIDGKMKFTYAEDAYKYILEVMNEQR